MYSATGGFYGRLGAARGLRRLPSDPTHQKGRSRKGLPRARHQSPPQCSDQVHRGSGAGRGPAATIPHRSAGDRAAQPFQRRHRLQVRRGRGAALPRLRVRLRDPLGFARPPGLARPVAARGRGACPGPRRSPRARDSSPGHQAIECGAHRPAAARGQADRLRPREVRRRRRPHREPAHGFVHPGRVAPGRRDGHAGLHGAGVPSRRCGSA